MNNLTFQCNQILEKCKNKSCVYYWDEYNNFKSLTYQQVSDISVVLTENLKKAIVEDRRTCVGLYMKKNYYIPSLILSLQQCNCAFTFLDPQTSQQTIISISQRLSLNWILSYNEKIQADDFLSSSYNKIANFENLILWKNINTEDKSTNYENILYAITTSGTTTRPKTVKVTMNSIVSNINSLRNKFNLSEDDVIHFGTPLTFDPFAVELFLALTTGCTLVLPPRPGLNIDVLFPKNSARKGVTVLQTVPSLLCKWSDADLEFLLQKSSCRILALGGEKFPKQLLTLPRSKNLRLFNLYGITEVSCWASICEITDMEVSLGEPLQDTVLEVRDSHGVKISEGEGELYIGSDFRICYVDEETDCDLIKPVFRTTGDLVRIKNARLTYVGRTNGIIKRLGNKVNLLTIQETVERSTNLLNTCIWIEPLEKLVLFLVIKEFDNTTKARIVDKIRVKLLNVLPQECYPDDIELIPSLPTTNHGKVDRKTLEQLYRGLFNYDDKRSAVDLFQLLWCKYLGLNLDSTTSYINCNFFDLGGNSIAIIQCLSEFRERIGTDYPNQLNTFMFENTLKDCCECVKDIKIKVNRKRNLDGLPCSLRIQSQDVVEMKIRWKYCLKACVDSSPTIINNRLVAIGSFSHNFAVLDCSSGNAIMEIELPDAIESACCASPCNKYIYTGCYDGNMYCIEIATGNIVWQYSSSDRIKCTPCIVPQNNSIIFGSYDKHLHCVDFNDGRALWKTNLFGGVTSQPLIHEDFIYVATILGTCFCVKYLNGEITWRYGIGVPVFGNPCLIYTFNCVVWVDVNGLLHALSYKSGDKLWNFKVDGNIYSSVVNVDNFLTFGSTNGKLYCVEVKRSGKLKYALTLDSSISSTPNIFRYKSECYCIAATNNGTLYMTDFNKGVIMGQLSLTGEIFSSPTVVDSNIYVGCRDNNIYCIQFYCKEIKR